MKPWERFLEQYTAFGQKPTVDSYVALFDPEGTVKHPGMAKSISLDHIPDFISGVLARLPEFHFIPVHWSVTGDTIFVEANNTAFVNGKRIVWPATYCITLRGDRVLRGRAYYDRTEVLSHFEPALAAQGQNAHTTLLEGVQPSGASASEVDTSTEVYERIVKPYVENWQHMDPERFKEFYRPNALMINPGFERPLHPHELAGYYTDLKAQIPDLQLHLEMWAASPGLLFCEWTATGTFNGKPMRLGFVDRFTLEDRHAVEGVAYFDALALRALAEPALASFADLSLSAPSAPR
jgi:ketosteroid isomerase-like protein